MNDVIIVGGGLAGLYAAVNLCEKFKITVIESQEFPYDKCCAEMFSPVAFEEIKQLNPPEEIFNFSNKLYFRFIDNDNNYQPESRIPYYSINRLRLNRWLKSLLQKNVTFIDRSRPVALKSTEVGYSLDIKNNKNTEIINISTKYLIGADGFNSFVRRILFDNFNPPRIFASQFEVKVPFPEDESHFIFDKSISKDFYSWIVPKKFGFIAGTETKDRTNLSQYILNKYNIDISNSEMKTHAITKVKSLDDIRLGEDKHFLIGEAAGLVHPSSGEGITGALVSARLAAEVINNNGESTVDDYINNCKVLLQSIMRDIHVNAIIFQPEKRIDFFKKLNLN